jgi:predicted MFS family arabinose efflux permease
VGSAATTGAAINAIVAPWFDNERPKALSMAFNGASIGGLIFTPLWAVAIGRFGFATTAVFMGIAALAVLWPVSTRYLRAGPGVAAGTTPSTLTNAALLRDRGFLAISAAFALGLFAQVGLFAHLVTRLAPVVGTDGAALAVSLVTMCAVFGRSLFRRLLRDDNRRQVAALNFLVQAAGTMFLTLASSTPALVSGCVLFGLGVGNLVSLPPLIIQKEFATGDVSKAVALMVAITQAVFAFAPAMLGAVRDIASGYVWSFGVAAAIQLASAGIILIKPARRHHLRLPRLFRFSPCRRYSRVEILWQKQPLRHRARGSLADGAGRLVGDVEIAAQRDDPVLHDCHDTSRAHSVQPRQLHDTV